MAAQRAAVETIPVNEGAIRAAAQDVATAQADMAVDQARLHSDIFSILTVEQQTKAKQLEAQAQARAKERRQRSGSAPKGQV
jgi:Spy/CpxP family protein refolding chaperone